MAGENIWSVTPHRIIGKGLVEFAIGVQNPMEKAELRIGAHTKKYRVLSPREVLKVTLEPSELEPFMEKGPIEVSCAERKKI